MEQTKIQQDLTSQVKKNILAYFQNHDLAYVADDAVFTNLNTGEIHKGKAEVGAMLHYMYNVAFNAKAEIVNTIVAEDKAVVEAYFKGRHIGEFAGIKATHKEIDVPLTVSYELKNGLIKKARIYLLTDVLFNQLGVQPTAGSRKTTYLIRDIFQLKFGHFRDVKALLDDADEKKLFPKSKNMRILTDFTGDAYRLILEGGFDTLNEYEMDLSGGMATREFQDWYGKFKQHVERSSREILKQIR
jgi:predicted ester cyclase